MHAVPVDSPHDRIVRGGRHVTTYAERPEYVDPALDMPDTWPDFMRHDLVAAAFLGEVVENFPHLTVVATLDDEPVARGLAAPFALHTDRRRGVLPPDGWDRVLLWAARDHRTGAPVDTVSALEIAIHPDHLGRGLSRTVLGAMRDAAAAAGFAELVAPVRPNQKHLDVHLPMADYLDRTREDGLPVDAWLRTHVRAGATVDSVAPTSMVMTGTLEQWRERTGLPFDTAGEVEVPGALVPVICRPEHDYAVYVEPNVWVRHALR
jgi:GNAT superfamily N-acetyltransferase